MSRRIIIVLLFLLLFPPAPVSEAALVGTGRDQIWRLRITEVFREYDPTPDRKADPLILHITFTDPRGRLLEAVTVKLKYKGEEEEFEPVRPGVFLLELSRSLRKKGGMLEMRIEDYWGLVETHIRSRAGTDEESALQVPEILSSDGMSVLDSGTHPGKVFYASEEELPTARRALGVMERTYPVIRDLLGADPAQPFAVVLTPRETPQVLEQQGSWPYPYNRQSLEEFRVSLITAWVESSLEGLVNLNTDRRNRWVSEGIVGWITAKTLAAGGEKRSLVEWLDSLIAGVDSLRGSPRPTFNLPGFTWPLARGFVEGKSLEPYRAAEAGTAVSLAFFNKLSRRHGDDFIRRLIQSMASMREGARTNPNIIDAVDALSGDHYKLEIRSFSLLEARQFLVETRDAAMALPDDPAGE
jgi:hypothetical protein